MKLWFARLAAAVVPLAAAAWAVLVLAAPLLSAPGRPPGGRVVTALAYVAGSLLCHQQPARSFHLAGAQLPVCARCTGLYVAGAMSLLIGWALRGRRDPVGRLARAYSWRAVLVAASLPIAVSVGLEWVGAWAASNAWRAVSALPAGWAAGALVSESLSFRGKL